MRLSFFFHLSIKVTDCSLVEASASIYLKRNLMYQASLLCLFPTNSTLLVLISYFTDHVWVIFKFVDS